MTQRQQWLSGSCCMLALALSTLTTTARAAETADEQPSGLSEIVVTAQKRAQNQQDVPISVTALSSETLEANRITSVIDLATAVPNMASRLTAGGALIPSFTMRGLTSYGVVPGSDKQLSIYIDGVYVGSTVGSGLDLPELERVEVLRGPQGTLFGRNSTIGAISVITRDPPKEFGINQEFTVGNYNEFRSKTRVDLGSFGPFSATVSYLHDERRGEIRNLGAGSTLTYPASAGIPTSQTSPEWLGSKNVNTVFAAIKFEPNSDFQLVNKFDWTGNEYTPYGAALVGIYPDALGPQGGAFLNAIIATQATPPVFVTDGQRPDTVNNSFSMPSYARVWGDSLTAQYQAGDHLSFKNILAYRESYVRASNQIDGFGGLTISPVLAPLLGVPAGSPFIVLGIEQLTTSEQWSNEFQVNYDSKLVTLTAGALYFHLKTESGGAPGLPNNITLSPLPGGAVFATDSAPQSRAFNKAKSIAGYVQAEVHVTPQLDLIGGFRLTNDKKSGTLVGGTPAAPTAISFTYNKTKPSFLAGVNYKPTQDILLFAKYSTAFVSGGASGPIVYQPETAKSWEAGIKSDWLDHRLRANLALFRVSYDHLQSAQAGITLGHPEIGLAVADQGGAIAKGFEFEGTAVPVDGLTLGFAAGYTDVKFTSVNPILGVLGVPGTTENFLPTLQPKWTTNLSAEYKTPPVIGDSRLAFRIDASWRDKVRTNSYTVLYALPQYDSVKFSPARWLVNTRVSLDDIQLFSGTASLAVWAKNLNNTKVITFPDILGGFVASTEFEPARTYGLDVTFNF